MGSECVNTGTLAKDSRLEYYQKQDQMQKMFTDKVVPIANRLPFFSNQYRMVWISLKQSWLLEFPHQNNQEKYARGL